MESQNCILGAGGELSEQRVRTTPDRFADVLGDRPRAEGHHRRVPAALTLHAQQTVLEPATLELRLELAPPERRQAARAVLPGRPAKNVGRWVAMVR